MRIPSARSFAPPAVMSVPVERYVMARRLVAVVLTGLGVAAAMSTRSNVWTALFPSFLLFALSFNILARPLIERRRFALGTALFAVAGIGILLAKFTQDRDPWAYVVSVKIGRGSRDAQSLLRDIVSPAVLDDALRCGLSTLPRFAGATDRIAELRRLLSVRISPDSGWIQIAMPSSSYPDHGKIRTALIVSCEKFRVLKAAGFASGLPESGRWSSPQAVILLVAWACWTCGFAWWLHRRSK